MTTTKPVTTTSKPVTTTAPVTTTVPVTTTQPTPDPEPEPQAAIKVITWNIQGSYTGSDYGYRENNVKTVIAENLADVYCLQECYGSKPDYGFLGLGSLKNPDKCYWNIDDKKNLLATMAGYTLVEETAKMTDEPDDFIFYNAKTVTLIKGGYYQLMKKNDSVGSDKSKHTRYVTWAVFEHKATGKQFLVLNTHLDNSTAAVRLEQANKLFAFIDSNLAQYKSLPMILCGDMNADYQTGKNSNGSYYHPTESTFNKLNDGTYFKWAKQRNGVQFVADNMPNFHWYSGYPYTLINNAFVKDFPNDGTAEDQGSNMDKRIIDFIFVSDNITPTKYSVIYRNFSTKKNCWKYASDHMPVACEMKF